MPRIVVECVESSVTQRQQSTPSMLLHFSVKSRALDRVTDSAHQRTAALGQRGTPTIPPVVQLLVVVSMRWQLVVLAIACHKLPDNMIISVVLPLPPKTPRRRITARRGARRCPTKCPRLERGFPRIPEHRCRLLQKRIYQK